MKREPRDSQEPGRSKLRIHQVEGQEYADQWPNNGHRRTGKGDP